MPAAVKPDCKDSEQISQESACFGIQEKVALGISLLGVLISLGFGIAAVFLQKKYRLAIADFTATFFFILISSWIIYEPKSSKPKWFLSTFICILFYYYFVTGGADGYGFLWGIMIPILVPFFLGYKIGIIFSVTYMAIFVATLLLGEYFLPSFKIGLSFTMIRYFAEYLVAGIIATLFSYEQTKGRQAISQEIEKRKSGEQRLAILFQDSPESYFVLENNSFTDCNKAVEQMFGFSHAEIIGHGPEIISPEKQPDGRLSSQVAIEKIALAFATGKVTFEWKHRRKNGQEFWALISLVSTMLDGRPIILASCRDIDERKLAADRLADLLSETERVNRLMAGREDRVLELKKEVNKLSRELGRDIVYSSVEDDS